jgi:hypothetical protein
MWKRRSVWLLSTLLVGLTCLFLLRASNATRAAYGQVTPGMHRDQVWAAFKRPPDARIRVVTFIPGPFPVNRPVEIWGTVEEGAHVLYDDEGIVVHKEWRTVPAWFRRAAARLGIPLPSRPPCRECVSF